MLLYSRTAMFNMYWGNYMHRKLSALFLGVILLTLTVASDVLAQTYGVQNNSPVPINVSVQGTCPGPPPLAWITPVIIVPPGGAVLIPIPAPPCVVTGVIVNGAFYAVGYSGPIITPNPPTRIRVGAMRAVVW